MATKNPQILQTSVRKNSQPPHHTLEQIGNFMDSLLNNMKAQFKNIKQNKNNDSSSFRSGSQNLPIVTYPNKLPPNIFLPKPAEAIIKNAMDGPSSHFVPLKTSKNRSKSSSLNKRVTPSKRNTSVKSSTSKTPNFERQSNSKPSSRNNKRPNDKPSKVSTSNTAKVASPRKMKVVYKENDKFVSKSLSSMIRNTKTPQIVTTEHIIVRKSSKIARSASNTSRFSKGVHRIFPNNRSSSTGPKSNKPSSSKPAANSQNTKKVIHEALIRKIPETNFRKNGNRPMSSNVTRNTSKRSLYNNNVRAASCKNKPKEDTHNQRPKTPIPIRKKTVPALCPPSTAPPSYPKQSEQKLIVANVSTHPKAGPSSVKLIIDNVPMTADGKPIKFMKNNENKKKQEDTQKTINETGDNSLKIINEKLQDIFHKIKEEKDATAHAIKDCLVDKFGTPVLMTTQKPDIVTVIKAINNNVNNIPNNNNNNNVTVIKPANNTVNNNANNNWNKNAVSNNNNNNVVKQNINNNNNNNVVKQNINNNNNNNVVKQNINNNNNNNVVKQNVNNNNNKQNVNTNINNNNKQNSNNNPIIVKTATNNNFNKPITNTQSNNNANKPNTNIQTNNVLVKKGVQKTPSFNNQRKVSNIICKPKTSIHSAIVPKTSNFANNIGISRKLSCLTPMEIIQDYVALVNRAKRDRKTYTVCGNFFSIRRAFSERGWVEKIRINVQDDRELKQIENMSNFELVENMGNRENGEKYRRMFISKLLAGHQVDFYWDYQTNPFNVNNDKVKRTLINRFPYNATRSYTSKAGLSDSLKEAYWFYTEGYSNILFPRTYNLAHDEELQLFVDDFRLTAAVSLLIWVSKNSEKPLNIISPNGTIPVSVFNFATLQCYNFIKHKEHKDLDSTIPIARDAEWDIFLEKFYKLIHQGQHFKESDLINAPLLLDQSKYILGKLRRYIPYIDTDGNMNLWLLKPNNGSRGIGIHVCRTLKYALDTIHQRKDIKYVVQKYLEKPLLIHNTKFDIRQYFLVTCMPNVQVWLYKDNYLRFSSQMYDLSKLHESIHLTNNSIQCRYRNNANRSNALPDQNMWHSDTFRKYLSDIGQPYAWRNSVYKGIKECLVGLFMLCQDKIVTRVNSFELCGADFMVAEDYRPYLIEINSRPALYPSTRITAQICPKVLEDLIKVTIDYQRNPRASTGNFELIYKESNNTFPPKDVTALTIEGISYSKLPCKHKVQEIKELPKSKSITLKTEDDITGYNIRQILNIDPNKVRKDVKNTLEKILAIIHSKQNELDKTQSEEKRLQFRMMLAEFVDIISGLKPT